MVTELGQYYLRLIATIFKRSKSKPRSITHQDVLRERTRQRRLFNAWHKPVRGKSKGESK